jgi:GAF domain-containing protein
MSFLEALFAITRAVGWDRGDGVVSALDKFLREEVSFEAGEVAVLGPIGFDHYLLSGDSVAGEDILLEARRRGGPIRIDDIRLISEYPRTAQAMERAGLRSILLVPLGSKGGIEGWIVLAQDYSFAFAGVSLGRLEAVAAMAGLALQNAQTLTRLHKRIPLGLASGEEVASKAPLPAASEGEEETAPFEEESPREEAALEAPREAPFAPAEAAPEASSEAFEKVPEPPTGLGVAEAPAAEPREATPVTASLPAEVSPQEAPPVEKDEAPAAPSLAQEEAGASVPPAIGGEVVALEAPVPVAESVAGVASPAEGGSTPLPLAADRDLAPARPPGGSLRRRPVRPIRDGREKL